MSGAGNTGAGAEGSGAEGAARGGAGAGRGEESVGGEEPADAGPWDRVGPGVEAPPVAARAGRVGEKGSAGALAYHTPGRRPPVEWHAGHRVGLGCGLSVAWFFGSLALLNRNWPGVGEVVMVPLGWVAVWVNARHHTSYHVPLERALVANSIFWGFLIAFALFRRRRRGARVES